MGSPDPGPWLVDPVIETGEVALEDPFTADPMDLWSLFL